MKYSEFRVEVEGIGLHIGVYELNIDVVDKHGDTVGCIAKNVEMSMDTDFEDFRKLPQEKKIFVFESLYKLAKTPLAEREEEKRYWLRFTTPTLLKNFIPDGYLNIHRESNEVSLSSDKKDTEYFKTIFTESEIAKMDITGFQKVEVLDGE